MVATKISENAYEWSWSESPSVNLSYSILQYTDAIRQTFTDENSFEMVPGLNSFAISFFEANSVNDSIVQQIDELVARPIHTEGTQVGQLHRVGVNYQGEDLISLSESLGLTIEEIITRHSACEFFVALLGFQKHFPYMLGLDPLLQLPRKSSPSVRVVPGSVAIAEQMCGVYPQSSPGGWHILGQMKLEELHQFQWGDRVQFYPESIK